MAYGETQIKNWPPSDRPRERILAQGPESLTDPALLAILLRTGTKGESAVELAKKLLRNFGSLKGVFSAPHGELRLIKGIKGAKIAQLLAAAELIKRQARESLVDGTLVDRPEKVFEYLTLSMGNYQRESFRVLFLNRKKMLLADEVIFEGTVDESFVYPREVVKRALERNASSVIFAHNHPTSSASPSIDDFQITRNLVRACHTVEISVDDHIIIGTGGCVSLRKEHPELFVP